MKKTLFITMLAMLFTFGANAEVKKAVYTVNPKMSCQNCENKIKSNLRFEKGVKNIETSLDAQTVTVTYDDTKTSPEKIVAGLKKVGYAASPAASGGTGKTVSGKKTSAAQSTAKAADKECDGKCSKADGCCKAGEKKCDGKCSSDKKCDGKCSADKKCDGKCSADKKCDGKCSADKKCDGKCSKVEAACKKGEKKCEGQCVKKADASSKEQLAKKITSKKK